MKKQLTTEQILENIKRKIPPWVPEITIERIFENLSHKAPEIVTRKKLNELTGGLVSEKTLANLDSEGTGIQPRIRIGGKVAYPRDAAINWLKNRCDFF